VVVSGWQVYDNKGRVVEKFEPYFDRGWHYKPPAPAQLGQRTRLFYDPRGQVIRTVNPDGSEQRVILGVPGTIAAPQLDSLDAFEPTPWENYGYDGNDLASATSLAGRAPVAHHFTPASARVDALGRVICQVARNGPDPAADWFVVRSAYDVRGNLLQLIDALGRQAFVHAYDLLNRSLRVENIDAGLRTAVLDAAGNLVKTRDSRGSLVVRIYDPLNRPKQVWARDDRQGVFTLREQIDYGDGGSHAVAIASNSLGKPSRHADEAGVLEFLGYDFKGNLTDKKRRVISDAVLAGGRGTDWSDPAAERALDATEYVTSTRYDALNRAVEMQYPADVNGHRARLVPSYNRAGALERVALDGAVYVERIAYNARGQRTLLAYGNGVMTRYGYDPTSFRLARLRTEGYSAAGVTYRPAGDVRQDFAYGYDLAGNILAIDERAKSCGVRNSTDGADRLVRRFDYDPVYRLTSATGRACAGIGTPRSLDDNPRCGFFSAGSATASQDNAPDLTEAYTEVYRYDPAGNLRELRYGAMNGSWTRTFSTLLVNNRLNDLTNGSTTHAFGYDPNGNLIEQNTDRHHGWDHADRMASFGIHPATGPASVQARYLYGADGMRVKKWVRKGGAAGKDESTVHIDGLFEHCRWNEGGQPKQNNRLHVMDARGRIAIVRIGDKHANDAWPNVQYHLADHLGCSHLVIGGDTPSANALINREEYFPHGETSFGSFAKKRYRYTGKERDEESGSYYQWRSLLRAMAGKVAQH
jgi:YD repeat-containing protein